MTMPKLLTLEHLQRLVFFFGHDDVRCPNLKMDFLSYQPKSGALEFRDKNLRTNYKLNLLEALLVLYIYRQIFFHSYNAKYIITTSVIR